MALTHLVLPFAVLSHFADWSSKLRIQCLSVMLKLRNAHTVSEFRVDDFSLV